MSTTSQKPHDVTLSRNQTFHVPLTGGQQPAFIETDFSHPLSPNSLTHSSASLGVTGSNRVSDRSSSNGISGVRNNVNTSSFQHLDSLNHSSANRGVSGLNRVSDRSSPNGISRVRSNVYTSQHPGEMSTIRAAHSHSVGLHEEGRPDLQDLTSRRKHMLDMRANQPPAHRNKVNESSSMTTSRTKESRTPSAERYHAKHGKDVTNVSSLLLARPISYLTLGGGLIMTPEAQSDFRNVSGYLNNYNNNSAVYGNTKASTVPSDNLPQLFPGPNSVPHRSAFTATSQSVSPRIKTGNGRMDGNGRISHSASSARHRASEPNRVLSNNGRNAPNISSVNLQSHLRSALQAGSVYRNGSNSGNSQRNLTSIGILNNPRHAGTLNNSIHQANFSHNKSFRDLTPQDYHSILRQDLTPPVSRNSTLNTSHTDQYWQGFNPSSTSLSMASHILQPTVLHGSGRHSAEPRRGGQNLSFGFNRDAHINNSNNNNNHQEKRRSIQLPYGSNYQTDLDMQLLARTIKQSPGKYSYADGRLSTSPFEQPKNSYSKGIVKQEPTDYMGIDPLISGSIESRYFHQSSNSNHSSIVAPRSSSVQSRPSSHSSFLSDCLDDAVPVDFSKKGREFSEHNEVLDFSRKSATASSVSNVEKVSDSGMSREKSVKDINSINAQEMNQLNQENHGNVLDLTAPVYLTKKENLAETKSDISDIKICDNDYETLTERINKDMTKDSVPNNCDIHPSDKKVLVSDNNNKNVISNGCSVSRSNDGIIKTSPLSERNPSKKILLTQNKILPNNASQNSGAADEDGKFRYEEKEFVWDEYLEETGSTAVPETSFRHVECSVQSGFEKGMKVEVANKSTPETYWIAGILMTCGQLLRMRPEGMPVGDSSADFWCDLTTSDVHQLGWAEANQHNVCPPQDIQHKMTDWQTVKEQALKFGRSPPLYMLSKQSGALPIDQIKEGMYIEVQNQLEPGSVWPVLVVQNVGGRLLVRYEGITTSERDFWLFYLNPRIHPLGWAESNECTYKPPIELIDTKGILGESQTKLSLEWLEKNLNKQPPSDIFSDQEEISEHGLTAEDIGSKLECLNMEALNLLKEKSNFSDSGEPYHSAVFPATITKVINQFYFIVQLDGDFVKDDQKVVIEKCCYARSPDLFPVGWCSKSGLKIMSIPGCEQKELDWQTYLRDTGSHAAREDLFIADEDEMNYEESMFQSGMKLEASDPNNPSEICVVTICYAKSRLLWLSSDCDENGSYNVINCHSQEIFPIGWCETNNYQLKSPIRRVAIRIEKKPNESLMLEKRNESEAERCALYQSLKEADAGKSSGWCPKIYFNYRCFTGPFLSKGRLVLLPQSVGPGPVTLVMSEVLSMLVSVAYKSSRVLKELQSNGQAVPNMRQQVLHAKYKGKGYSAPVDICTRNGQVDEFCRTVCRKLKCCLNLISSQCYSTGCPENCSRETKTKYTTYYNKKKKKVGRPSLGEKQLMGELADDPAVDSKPGRRKRHRKIILSLRKKRSNHSVNRNSPTDTPLEEEYEVDNARRVNRLESITWEEDFDSSSTETSNKADEEYSQSVKDLLKLKRRHAQSSTDLHSWNSYDEAKKRRKDDVTLPDDLVERRTRGGGQQRAKYVFDSKTHKKVLFGPTVEGAEEQMTKDEEKNTGKPSSSLYKLMRFDNEEDIHPDKNPLHWTVDDVLEFLKSTDCANLGRLIKEQDIDGQSLLMLTLPTIQEHLIPRLGPAVKLCHQIERLKIAFFQYFA